MEGIIGASVVIVMISIYLISRKNKNSDSSTIRYQISTD